MTESDDEAHRRRRERFLRHFATAVPHNQAIGMELVDVGEGTVRFRLPYREDLVGNLETGVIFGGAITAMLDAACGTAVFSALAEPQPIATLDLRIDYMGAATPHRDVHARADVYKMTKHVGFVRALAFHDDEKDPIAAATGTFMIGTRVTRGG